MSESVDRRRFLGIAAATAVATQAMRPEEKVEAAPGGVVTDPPDPERNPSRPFLTPARDFFDVSRGNPRPSTLKGEALTRARLTADSWRLEIVGDGSSEVARPRRLEDRTALDMATLREIGKSHGVKYLKAMQCNNIPTPLGQGLWEGVPLREVIGRVGLVGNVRRVYFWGFHNNDPAQLFQSSLPFNRVMETPPWEPPAIVAYRLNGEDIPLQRGGPVRMVVPWAHGFKSIKWLQRIVLTNDYKANDTYALQNNDPESYLKTAAYLAKGATSFKAGAAIDIEGTAMSGWSGLAGRILAASGGRNGWKARRRRSCLEDGHLAALRDDDPARRLGIDPPGRYIAPRSLGLRSRDRQAPKLAVAIQHGLLERADAGAEAGNVRVPRTYGQPEWIRPARASAVSEVRSEPGAVQDLLRNGVNRGRRNPADVRWRCRTLAVRLAGSRIAHGCATEDQSPRRWHGESV